MRLNKQPITKGVFMKKSLFALGVGLLLSTSVLAGDWYYVQNPYAPAYGGYQQPVVRQVAPTPQQTYQSPAIKHRGLVLKRNGLAKSLPNIELATPCIVRQPVKPC